MFSFRFVQAKHAKIWRRNCSFSPYKFGLQTKTLNRSYQFQLFQVLQRNYSIKHQEEKTVSNDSEIIVDYKTISFQGKLIKWEEIEKIYFMVHDDLLENQSYFWVICSSNCELSIPIKRSLKGSRLAEMIVELPSFDFRAFQFARFALTTPDQDMLFLVWKKEIVDPNKQQKNDSE